MANAMVLHRRRRRFVRIPSAASASQKLRAYPHGSLPGRPRSPVSRAAWILLIVLAFAATAASAKDSPWAPFISPRFATIGIAQGLPDSITTAVAQDQRGLVWIGTMGGLVRYDGYRMQVFEPTGHDGSGLPDAYVRALLPLPDGGLLVGTNTGGLSRLDPATGTFHNYPLHVDGSSDSKIYGLASDRAGGV